MTRILALTLVGFIAFAVFVVAADPEPNKPAGEGLTDYSSWKALTAQPIRVDRTIFLRCEPPDASTTRMAKARGPHFKPAVKFFANPGAAEAIQAGAKSPLPVGATIVKEKYWNEKDAKPTAYAAMIKREPGFDAEHGDWEYLFVEFPESGKKPVVTRGAIKSCVQCHSLAKEKDYVFRTYLTPPAANGNSPVK